MFDVTKFPLLETVVNGCFMTYGYTNTVTFLSVSAESEEQQWL